MPNGPVDVAAGAPNAASYTDNADGTVSDNITGLMWQKNIATVATSLTWAQAIAFCDTSTTGGHTDWRLPTAVELVSIVDYGASSPAINATYFPSTPVDGFWSSTPLADADVRWNVSFKDGHAGPTTLVQGDARCVR